MEEKKMGRPTKGDAVKTMKLSIRLNEEEKELLTRAAEADYRTLADWARKVLLKEAEKFKD